MKIIITENQARQIFNFLSEETEPALFKQLGKLGNVMNMGKLFTSNSQGNSNSTPESKQNYSTDVNPITNQNLDNKIISFFTSKGLSPEQAAGIGGNLYQESKLNPQVYGDNGTAYGIAQWRGSRLKQLQKLQPRNWKTFDGQLNFIWKELNSTEKRSLLKLKNTQTPEDAAMVFSKYYERPGIPHNDKRINYAQSMLVNYRK